MDIEQMTEIWNQLYFVRSILSVISDMDSKLITAWEEGDVATMALAGRVTLQEAFERIQALPEGLRAV